MAWSGCEKYWKFSYQRASSIAHHHPPVPFQYENYQKHFKLSYRVDFNVFERETKCACVVDDIKCACLIAFSENYNYFLAYMCLGMLVLSGQGTLRGDCFA